MKRHTLYITDNLRDHQALVKAAIEIGGGTTITCVPRAGMSMVVEYNTNSPDDDTEVMHVIQPLFPAFHRDRRLDDYPVGERWLLENTDIGGGEQMVVHAYMGGKIDDQYVCVVLEYDGAINADPGSNGVAERRSDGKWWLAGELFAEHGKNGKGERILRRWEGEDD